MSPFGSCGAIDVLVHFAGSWPNFRLAELDAVAETVGAKLRLDPAAVAEFEARLHLDTCESLLLPVQVSDAAGAARIAARCVLVKECMHVWASGASWEALAARLRAYPRELAEPYLLRGSTFRVNVTSVGKRLSDEERLAYIKALGPLLPWQGKVRMKGADHVFTIVVDFTRAIGLVGPVGGGVAADDAGVEPRGEARGAAAAPHFHFARRVAEGRRDLVGKYDLKRRK